MVEGSTPYSFAEMEQVLDKMDETTRRGESVLVHCRGGKDSVTFLENFFTGKNMTSRCGRDSARVIFGEKKVITWSLSLGSQ